MLVSREMSVSCFNTASVWFVRKQNTENNLFSSKRNLQNDLPLHKNNVTEKP